MLSDRVVFHPMIFNGNVAWGAAYAANSIIQENFTAVFNDPMYMVGWRFELREFPWNSKLVG